MRRGATRTERARVLFSADADPNEDADGDADRGESHCAHPPRTSGVSVFGEGEGDGASATESASASSGHSTFAGCPKSAGVCREGEAVAEREGRAERGPWPHARARRSSSMSTAGRVSSLGCESECEEMEVGWGGLRWRAGLESAALAMVLVFCRCEWGCEWER